MRLPPAAPPHLTIPPVVVPTAALEDLAALQAIDQTHDNGFEPLMERAAVLDWLSANSSAKLSLPRYESPHAALQTPQQVSDARIAGPVWVITEPDSVVRLIAALTPKEAAHDVSKELVNLRFMQQLGEDEDGGVYLACHVQLMNLFADRVIIPVFRSTKSYMEASRIHFYITRAQAQHVVPVPQEGNRHLHHFLGEHLRSNKLCCPPDYDSAQPFYTWSILDSNGLAYVLVHLKRRIYSHYQYRCLTVLDGSPNPLDAGEGTGAAKGGRHRSGTVSNKSAMQLTLLLEVAADLLDKLDRFAEKKRMEGAFLPPEPASWAPVKLAEKLRAKYGPFLFPPSNKELLLLRQRNLDNARTICRTAARLSLPAALSALGYIPKLPSSWFNKLRRGSTSIGKPITVSQANFEARQLLRSFLPTPDVDGFVRCAGCQRYFLVRAPPLPAGGTFTQGYAHLLPRGKSCKDQIRVPFASRFIPSTCNLNGCKAGDEVNTITLRLHDCEHQTDVFIVGWYMSIQDDLIGSEVVRALLKRYIKKNMQH